MITRSMNFANRLRNEEVGSPMVKRAVRFVKRIGADEAGITALETAIILIAFVVVASVFAFTMLSAGTFSTERGKEAIYAGMKEVQSSMELKGGLIALAETATTTSTTGTVGSLVFTLANVLGGEAINLDDSASAVLVVEYRDDSQRVALTPETDWAVNWLSGDGDTMLETGELAEVTVQIAAAATPIVLGINTTFVIEIKPPSGAVLNLQRTTPSWLELVNDLN